MKAPKEHDNEDIDETTSHMTSKHGGDSTSTYHGKSKNKHTNMLNKNNGKPVTYLNNTPAKKSKITKTQPQVQYSHQYDNNMFMNDDDDDDDDVAQVKNLYIYDSEYGVVTIECRDKWRKNEELLKAKQQEQQNSTINAKTRAEVAAAANTSLRADRRIPPVRFT